MSILKRFSDIMSSNINALLDKAEDPVKMIDQLMRNLNDDLNKVKAETASVMAEETRAKREYLERHRGSGCSDRAWLPHQSNRHRKSQKLRIPAETGGSGSKGHPELSGDCLEGGNCGQSF